MTATQIPLSPHQSLLNMRPPCLFKGKLWEVLGAIDKLLLTVVEAWGRGLGGTHILPFFREGHPYVTNHRDFNQILIINKKMA